MKILITGANGFVGSSLVDFFVKQSWKSLEINCLVRKTSNVERLNFISETIKKNNIRNISINFVYGDVREPQTLFRVVQDVDVIIHCAAVLRTNNIQTYYDVNHLGTKNLLEAILLHNPNIKSLIAISSQAVSGPCETLAQKSSEEKCEPVSHYGKSKLLGETELLKYKDKLNLKIIILRPGPIYGPYDKDMFLYFQYAQKGMLPVFSKEFFVQFTFIDDLAKVCAKIIEDAINNSNKIISGTYFVAEDRCYSIEEIKEIFVQVMNKKIKVIKIPYFFAYLYAYANEIIHEKIFKKPAVFNRDKLDELKHPYWLCQSSSIKDMLGFVYTPLIDGIKKTYQWYKENKWL